MSKIKNFLKKKKEEAAFKLKLGGSMGQGHSLNASKPEPSSSVRKPPPDAYIPPKRNELSAEARAAATAALSRIEKKDSKDFNTSLAAIKAQAKRELEAERKQRENSESKLEAVQSTPIIENKNLTCNGVYFRCPLVSDEVLPKKEWQGRIKDFLYQQLEEERALTASMIIWNCNTKEKAEECIQTLSKYLENIINHPEEEKYLKIRMSNKVFSEKVRYVEGALEFLRAAGFTEIEIDGESFLLWCKDNIEENFNLQDLLESLKNSEIIQLTLDRNIQVLLPSQVRRVALPDEFYRITPEEIKREQQLRTEAIENAQILRTKAMREREEQRNLRIYRYSLVRVKFPNGIHIQGTFNVYDTIRDVYEFVQSCLGNENLEFSLATTTEGKFGEEEMDKTLADLRLIPNALLLFTTPGLNMSAMSETNFLKEELLMLVQEI